MGTAQTAMVSIPTCAIVDGLKYPVKSSGTDNVWIVRINRQGIHVQTSEASVSEASGDRCPASAVCTLKDARRSGIDQLRIDRINYYRSDCVEIVLSFLVSVEVRKTVIEFAPGCTAVSTLVNATERSPSIENIRIARINCQRQDCAAVIGAQIHYRPEVSTVRALPHSTPSNRAARVHCVRIARIDRQRMVNSKRPDAVFGYAPTGAAIDCLVDGLVGDAGIGNVRARRVNDIRTGRIDCQRKYIDGTILIRQSVLDCVPTCAAIG